MDKFEDIIKQAVEGYEAPYNPQAWDNVSKDLGDSFDQMMKESTGQYEAPYNPAAWEAVSSELGTSSTLWKWIGGAAAVVTATVGIFYFSQPNEEQQSSIQEDGTLTVAQNDIQEKENTNQPVVYTNTDEVTHPTENNTAVTNVESTPTNQDDIVDGASDATTTNNNSTTIDPNDDQTTHADNTNQHNNNLTVVDNGQEVEYNADASFKTSSSELCAGEKCVFTVSNPNSELNYIWAYGDGQFGTGLNGDHTYLRAGEFTARLEVRHPKTNKVLAVEKHAIVVNPNPKTDFSWEQSNEIIPTVQFINLTEEGVKWNWNIKGFKQSSQTEFEYTFRKAGTYLIDLTAENQFGCSATAQKTINIEQDYNLLAPTAFSPNGDFKNDAFIPKALQIMDDVQFTMNIMDKTGEIVYTTQNANEPWDGIIVTDNTPAPAGSAYIWRVVLTNKNGEKELYEGQIIVIR